MDYKKIVQRSFAISLLTLGALNFAHAQEASTQYRGTGRDPFVKFKPVVRRKAVAKTGDGKPAAPPAPKLVETPTIQARIDGYKAKKLQAMNAQQPAPKPVTALLLNEVQVIGIFRTPRGYAAMVEATPIKLSYVIYPGEMFFDGQLVAVEESRLVFRRENRYSNGKRETVIETKPLRAPNAVTDSLTATKENTAAPTATAESASTAAANAESKTSGTPR